MRGAFVANELADRMMAAFADAVVRAGATSPIGLVRDSIGRGVWPALALPILTDRLRALFTGPEYSGDRQAIRDGVAGATDALFAAVLADALRRFAELEV